MMTAAGQCRPALERSQISRANRRGVTRVLWKRHVDDLTFNEISTLG